MIHPREKFSALLIALVAMAFAAIVSPEFVCAQETHESDPTAALSSALTAACRANQNQFANYLTAENAVAFRALPNEQREALLRRFSLTNDPGKPLVSSDLENHTVLRCEAPRVTVEYRFGDPRSHENLAFIPVKVANGERTEFGLVRENGGWRLLSLGLVLLDIPQLSKQWGDQDLLAREEAAVETLRALTEAVQTYRRAWGKMPESLAQLGPAPKGEISPDQADLVNEDLASGSQGGFRYRFRILPVADRRDESFELAATPEDYGKTGRRSFLLDSTGKVHGADKHGAVATPEDSLIPGEKTQ